MTTLDTPFRVRLCSKTIEPQGVKKYRGHHCYSNHRTFTGLARCLWPNAYQIQGDGHYAVVIRVYTTYASQSKKWRDHHTHTFVYLLEDRESADELQGIAPRLKYNVTGCSVLTTRYQSSEIIWLPEPTHSLHKGEW